MLVAGDIGGTKTILTLVDPKRGSRDPLYEHTFSSNEFDCLENMIREFWRQAGAFPGYLGEKMLEGSFGVAGPVVDGRAQLSNLPWTIDAKRLKNNLGWKSVVLLNDLEAVAWSISHLERDDIFSLYSPNSLTTGETKHGNIAVVAPGTGLGEAFLTYISSHEARKGLVEGYIASASEGGHTEFAPTDDEQIELLRYLLQRYEHVSYERVISGLGIPNIYDFFHDGRRYEEPAQFRNRILNAKKNGQDVTPLILDAACASRNGSGPKCPIAEGVLKLFVKVLGAEAGNMALKTNAVGGVFLAGGIPPRILDVLQEDEFLEAYLAKGRMRSVVERMPVAVIVNPKSALFGAVCYGLRRRT